MTAGGELDLIDVLNQRVWPFHTVVLTAHSPEDCRMRLTTATAEFEERGATLDGEFRVDGGWLTPTDPDRLRPTLTMTFTPRGTGTEIRGHTSGDYIQLGIGLAIGLVMTPVTAVVLWNFFQAPPKPFDFETIFPYAFPALLMLGGLYHAWSTIMSAGRQHEGLVRFVCEAIGGEVAAEIVAAPPAPRARNIVE